MTAMQGQHVLILGLGTSGLAMARWCARQGARLTVADTRENPPGLAALREQVADARFVPGALDAALLHDAVQGIYRSPGLSPSQVATISEAAQASGVRLQGELDLFTQGLARLRDSQGYAPAVLAVTGTNGKTTVTAMTGQLVARTGRSVAVAGNIGPSLLDTLAGHLDAGTLPQVWVLELSSFQLEGVQGFEPSAGCVLNLTQDHLDWHGDMAAYAAAKARVFGQGGVMVLNRDDPAVMAMLPAPGKTRAGRPAEPRAHVTFGAGLPTRPGDFGIETANGMAWLVRALQADDGDGTRRRRAAGPPAPPGEPHESESVGAHELQRLMPADALRIQGRHNATNALAALALATAAGCPLAPMLHGLREYRGEPHRVESVGVVGEVEWFDDSKGTNVGATVAALEGLGAGGRKLVVILGGDGKGQDFAPLAPPVARHARAAVLIGRDAPRIQAALQAAGVPLVPAGSMAQAVEIAAAQARPGDAVLMSPACASFDMFQDYAHRARVFREAVAAHGAGQGAVLEGGSA